MVRKPKATTAPAAAESLEEVRSSRLRVALKTAMRTPRTSFLDAALPIDLPAPSKESLAQDILAKEVACARLFNVELPEDVTQAVELLEKAVATFTQTRQNVILLFDESAGTYICLNDEVDPSRKPRELTQISDGFLQDLLGSDTILHTYLFSDDAPVGMVAVAGKLDGKPFDAVDEVLLEILAPYLATKVRSYQNLKQSMLLSLVQKTILDISSRLVTAVDQESVLATTLEAFGEQLGFGYCQYIAMEQETGRCDVLMESAYGSLTSYFHAGLQSKRPNVDGFATMLSLFTSVARNKPFLHIPGSALGDKPLTEFFRLPAKPDDVYSALIIPVREPATGKVQGTFNLYRSEPQHINTETLEVATEAVDLVSRALSRAKVLELALEMASTDELTTLTNRRGFYERFEAEIERARRNQTSLSVAMIDVDFFKKLNDTYGHLNGDAALRGLAAILADSTRRSDVACRFGGEEFAVLLPETRLQDAQDLMERIRHTVETTVLEGVDSQALSITISVGLAQVNTTGDLSKPVREVISEALMRADEQLYAAKACGRNQVCTHCP